MEKHGDKEKEKNTLEEHGIIYISGSIEDGTSEAVCKQVIEMNIAGKVDHIPRLPIYTTGVWKKI